MRIVIVASASCWANASAFEDRIARFICARKKTMKKTICANGLKTPPSLDKWAPSWSEPAREAEFESTHNSYKNTVFSHLCTSKPLQKQQIYNISFFWRRWGASINF